MEAPPTPVQQIVSAFNGLRPTQRALDLPSVAQVQYWLETGRIREHYKPRIREAAKKLKVKLPPKAVFDQAFVASPRRAAA